MSTGSTISRREPIAEALFRAATEGCTQARVKLGTAVSRKIRHYAQVDASEMPALFQTQKPETQERGVIGLPAKRTMHFELWLYVCDAQEDSVIPSTQLNEIVDAIEQALEPYQTREGAVTQANTLGGLVVSARIDGSVEFYENVTTDGKSIAVVPVSVLLP